MREELCALRLYGGQWLLPTDPTTLLHRKPLSETLPSLCDCRLCFMATKSQMCQGVFIFQILYTKYSYESVEQAYI
jgi:hypothetical protein